MITREMARLIGGHLDRDMLYDPRPFMGNLRGIRSHQFCADWDVDAAKFALSLDDFSEKILISCAYKMAKEVVAHNGIVSFDLVIPSKGLIDSARHVFGGLSVRTIIANNIGTDSPRMRWDILIGEQVAIEQAAA